MPEIPTQKLIKHQIRVNIVSVSIRNARLLEDSKQLIQPFHGEMNDSPKRSTLRTIPSTSTGQFSPETVLAAIGERERTRPSGNDQRDLPIEGDIRSISSLKRSYASLPLSTAAVRNRPSIRSSRVSLIATDVSDQRKNSAKQRNFLFTPVQVGERHVRQTTLRGRFAEKNVRECQLQISADENLFLFSSVSFRGKSPAEAEVG